MEPLFGSMSCYNKSNKIKKRLFNKNRFFSLILSNHRFKIQLDFEMILSPKTHKDFFGWAQRLEQVEFVPSLFRCRLADFNTSPFSRRALTAGNQGSPLYMAPEQFYDRYDHRADLYALGVLRYEMLAGQTPFEGSLQELMQAHLRQIPDDLSPNKWTHENRSTLNV